MNNLCFRPATEADLPAIVAMMADDDIGTHCESPDDLAPYQRAFAEITNNPWVHQVVGERDGDVVATMQLTLIPSLSDRGQPRLHIEGVRVRSDLRGDGIGAEMIAWAIAYGREHACCFIEFTTNKRRTDAQRFYERLGFVQSHFGYKMVL